MIKKIFYTFSFLAGIFATFSMAGAEENSTPDVQSQCQKNLSASIKDSIEVYGSNLQVRHALCRNNDVDTINCATKILDEG